MRVVASYLGRGNSAENRHSLLTHLTARGILAHCGGKGTQYGSSPLHSTRLVGLDVPLPSLCVLIYPRILELMATSTTLAQIRGLRLGDARQILIFLAAYLAYMFSRRVVLGDVEPTAIANAFKVIDFQKSLGIFWELSWQRWFFLNADWVLVILNWAYIITFWPIIAVTAFLLYVKNRPRYFHYRNVVLVSFSVALLIFILFPLAPLRLVPDMPNWVDSIKFFGPSEYGSREMAWFFNAYAAMPSLHFGWTVLFGVLYFRSRGPWFLKLLGVAYPTITFFAITLTGNHYIVDAIAGGAVILASFLIYEGARRWYRRHPLSGWRRWPLRWRTSSL